MEDVKRVVHRVRCVLLEVLPAVAPRLLAALHAALAAQPKYVRPYRAGVRSEQLLPMDEAQEVTLVEQPPSRGARAEAQVLARVRAALVPVRVGAEERERVERGGQQARDPVVARDADGARRLR